MARENQVDTLAKAEILRITVANSQFSYNKTTWLPKNDQGITGGKLLGKPQ